MTSMPSAAEYPLDGRGKVLRKTAGPAGIDTHERAEQAKTWLTQWGDMPPRPDMEEEWGKGKSGEADTNTAYNRGRGQPCYTTCPPTTSAVLVSAPQPGADTGPPSGRRCRPCQKPRRSDMFVLPPCPWSSRLSWTKSPTEYRRLRLVLHSTEMGRKGIDMGSSRRMRMWYQKGLVFGSCAPKELRASRS